MKFSIRTAFVLTALTAILLTIGIGIFRVKKHFEESVSNSYRLVSAGELFLAYKKDTGNWPLNWESLEQYVTTNRSPLYACESFDDLKGNIDIDFSLDLVRVDTTTTWSDINPQIRIIASKTGETHGAIFDPNELIYSELQRESAKMRTKP